MGSEGQSEDGAKAHGNQSAISTPHDDTARRHPFPTTPRVDIVNHTSHALNLPSLCTPLLERGQHGSQRWDDGRTPEEALKDLGVSRLSPRDAARLHSDLRAAQVNVVASRMKWAALLKETDTVSQSFAGWMSWPELIGRAWNCIVRFFFMDSRGIKRRNWNGRE